MEREQSWLFTFILLFTAIVAEDVAPFRATLDGAVQGGLRRWHRQTIGFRGPTTSETDAVNPFLQYRLDVTFTHQQTGKVYKVPGYYAADGNAANTGTTAGNVWLVHFAPDEIGAWDWEASFRQGETIAISTSKGVSAGFFDGKTGTFMVVETNKIGGRDHRGKGRLKYVGSHHLRFSNGEWFLKGGTDSPENFLAYQYFDNTPNYGGRRKTWSPHSSDYSISRAKTWANGKGKEIMGALNYLALQKGLNAFSFLTMNTNGDDENVFPYISDAPGIDNYMRIDVSKTAQWEILFCHADRLGLFMHFKTQETENDHMLDGGALGDQRKLYYRELIARFSHHLALNWNVGEENTNTKAQRLEFAQYFKKHDPYKHPIVIHTKPDQQSKDNIFSGLLGATNYNGASLQSSQQDVYNDTVKWIELSAQAGRKWVVTNDEQAGAGVGIVPDGAPTDFNHDSARKNVLWANLLAGGAGVEYYYGSRFPENDMTLQDFRSRDQFFDQTRHALRFFKVNSIPFWKMSKYTETEFQDWMTLADAKRNIIVMYLPNTINMPTINFYGTEKTAYSLRWYDPRNGGLLQRGSVQRLGRGTGLNFGAPPSGPSDKDWVVLFRRVGGLPLKEVTRR